MLQNVKKYASMILVGVIVLLTLIAVLGIWDVIDLEYIIRKMLLSLFVIFISAVLILFIFSVLFRDDHNNPE